MSAAFSAVGWTRQKLWYDAVLVVLLLLGLAAYGIVIGLFHPNTTFETFVIRFTALSAVILLHIILAIGPLCRLNPQFLPLLYNRRHLGVTMFLLALIHGVFSILQFHAAGDANPLVSVFTAYEREYTSWLKHSGDIGQFPFEIFGFCALVIFFLLAATSHDFWLKQLGTPVWRTLHTGVYVAYGLVVLHIAFGALQSERNPIYVILLAAGFGTLTILHILAALKPRNASGKSVDPIVDTQPRFTRRIVIVLALFVPGLMTLVALCQNSVDGGGYEFGGERTFTGVLYADPLPLLHVTAGSISGHETSSPNLILVGAGKAAAPPDLMEHGNGKRVTVKGRLLYWHNMMMLEINDPGSFKVLGNAPDQLPVMKLGPSDLTGELVDTKCFFGAMRPATGKIHRGCAVRCLSGGVPPGILIRDGNDNAFVVMLTGQLDEQLEYNVQWAARMIEASGDLELYQGVLVLRADSVQLKEDQ